MGNSAFGSAWGSQKVVKRVVFVSYHHGGDQAYYDRFADTFCDTYAVISDNSLARQIDSEDVEYVMRRVRENYITGSSCTIVLVGKDTWRRKYVDWEIKATLDMNHGLIGVHLPSALASSQNAVIVPDRFHDNIQSGYAVWITWAQLMAGPQACTNYIEEANARPKRLIDNTRQRRLRNG